MQVQPDLSAITEQVQTDAISVVTKRRRNRASAKKAGTAMESCAAEYIDSRIEHDVERRRLQGAKDRGDIAGVKTLQGARVVVEVKDNNGSVKVKPWLDEAEIERGNDDALIGVVVFKRSGVGYQNPGQQGVLMTLDTLCTLLDGGVDL